MKFNIKKFEDWMNENTDEEEQWVLYDITDPINLVNGLKEPFKTKLEAIRNKPRDGDSFNKDWKAVTLEEYNKLISTVLYN